MKLTGALVSVTSISINVHSDIKHIFCIYNTDKSVKKFACNKQFVLHIFICCM